MNLIGHTYGRLRVLSFAYSKGHNKHWNCICDCGNTKSISQSKLRSGETKSCGCLRSELSSIRVKTHGDYKSKEYNSWRAMIERCYNPKHKYYKNYGGRGISVCDRWRESYKNFLQDMGRAKTVEHSLDRKDNNIGYEPSNCRWATKQEQCDNKRSNIIFKYNNETLTASQIRRKFNISKGCFDRDYYILKIPIDDIIKKRTKNKQ